MYFKLVYLKANKIIIIIIIKYDKYYECKCKYTKFKLYEINFMRKETVGHYKRNGFSFFNWLFFIITSFFSEELFELSRVLSEYFRIGL